MAEFDNSIYVSVIMPMFNEVSKIGDNIRRITTACTELGKPWELIVVNDGSTDNSDQIVADLAQKEVRIKLISYKNNRGRGYALRQGFKIAKGAYVITTESDLTWGAKIIDQLLTKLESDDYDVVIASPYLPGGGFQNVPWKRVFLSKVGNIILRKSVPERVTMLTGMTRGYRNTAIKNLDLDSNGKEIHLEIVSKAIALGYSIGEVPATLSWSKPRPGEERRKSNFYPGKYITSHLLFGFGESPLLLFGTIGISLLTIGLVMGCYALYLSLSGTPVHNRPIVLGSVLLILFGVQILLFCFLSIQNRDIRNKIIKLGSRIRVPFNNEKKDEG